MNIETPNLENQENKTFQGRVIDLSNKLMTLPEGPGENPRDHLNFQNLTKAMTALDILKKIPEDRSSNIDNIKQIILNECKVALQTIKYKNKGAFKNDNTIVLEEAMSILKELEDF